jgi:PAS domain S-box-containing protein
VLAEHALMEREERFRSIFDQAPIGIVSLDACGRITDANRALCEIVGRRLGELDGDLQAHLFDEAVAGPATTAAEDKPGQSLQVLLPRQRRVRRPDGTVRVTATSWRSMTTSMARSC